MKKKMMLRIFGIGIFHMVLYLYVVPFLIYPKFGNNGLKFTIAVAIIISVAIFGTMFCKEKIKGDKNE